MVLQKCQSDVRTLRSNKKIDTSKELTTKEGNLKEKPKKGRQSPLKDRERKEAETFLKERDKLKGNGTLAKERIQGKDRETNKNECTPSKDRAIKRSCESPEKEKVIDRVGPEEDTTGQTEEFSGDTTKEVKQGSVESAASSKEEVAMRDRNSRMSRKMLPGSSPAKAQQSPTGMQAPFCLFQLFWHV